MALSWQELEGFYTAFGDVTDLLAAADDRLAVFGSGEEVTLSFATAGLPALPAGWTRTLFLHSEGWEKDGDPNVACSQTVEPLPYRGMTDPCTRPRIAEASEGPGGRRTRWVSRDRLDRRVVAARPPGR